MGLWPGGRAGRAGVGEGEDAGGAGKGVGGGVGWIGEAGYPALLLSSSLTTRRSVSSNSVPPCSVGFEQALVPSDRA